MNYHITLKPLKAYLFGGETTYGRLGDKDESSYRVISQLFPQQSALLGMLRKELMTQNGLLTRKRKGEWVDTPHKAKAADLVGTDTFSMDSSALADFGQIKALSAVYLEHNGEKVIKMPDISGMTLLTSPAVYLKGYDPKKADLGRTYYNTQTAVFLSEEDIFCSVEQIGNQKDKSLGEEDALFKKRSYILKDGFSFAFDLECGVPFKESIVYLGADRTPFVMSVKAHVTHEMNIANNHNLLLLLGDALIEGDIGSMCDAAVTSEISFAMVSHLKGVQKSRMTEKNCFRKSRRYYLYEKGSIFLNPKKELIEQLKRPNLQQIGYNTYFISGETK